MIEKAKVSCEATGNIVADHFNDAIKPITGGKGAVQRVKDCYLSKQLRSKGQHARSAVGMTELPFGLSVEIEAEVEIRID